jgi:hypothetical protein
MERSVTADELSLIDAAAEGCAAGKHHLGPSLNPYQDGTPEHDIWEKSRSTVLGMLLNSTANLARSVC